LSHRLKIFLRQWLPPVLYRRLLDLSGNSTRFSVPQPNWKTALEHSTSYHSAELFEKVKIAALKVKNGEAAFERDSVVFDEIQYPFPLLACLQRISSARNNCLNVLDFGGSLGSTYFQCRNFLLGLDHLKWSIIEQPHFVEYGKKHIADDTLEFYDSIDEALTIDKPDVILLSSVLQYIERPYELLDKMKLANVEYILFDRTPCSSNSTEQITIQTVPSSIYSASYPAWVFDCNGIATYFSGTHRLLLGFDADDEEINMGDIQVKFKGFLFQRCKN